MRPISTAFAALALQKRRRRAARVFLCDDALNPVEDLSQYVTGGSVTMSRRSAVRRTLTLQVTNKRGINTPLTSADSFFLNRILKVERGFYIPGAGIELCNLGYFLVERPNSQATTTTLAVRGQDFFKHGRNAGFSQPGSFAEGTTLESVVQTCSTLLGLPARWNTSWGSTRILGMKVPYSLGQNIRDFCARIVEAFAGEWFISADAYVVLQEGLSDASLTPPVWTLEGTLTNVERELDDDLLFNRVIATGESASHLVGPIPHIPWGEARDLNPDSAYYNPGVGSHIDLVYVHVSADIFTDEQARAVAAVLLLEKELYTESVIITSVALPFLEEGDVVSVYNQKSGVADDYVLDSVEMPLLDGLMSMTARKLRALA